MIKDTDKKPNEEIYRMRSRTVPRTGASFPRELGYVTLPISRHVHPPESSPKPVLLGFLWRLNHTVNVQSLTPFPALLPSLEKRRTGLKTPSF